jgi:Protein of unknown function (DUF3048) N-terminal domain/Protein of unknown function (DUF3048) C-terminal domain
MNRAKAVSATALLTAIALLASACAPAEPIHEPNTTITSEPTVSRSAAPAPPEDPVPEKAFALTGIDAADATPDELKRPAISVKIENTEAARPQTNLDKADIVFEEEVEYGISRLIAIYQSQYPEDVGPIRSMRPMDQNVMGQFHGPLVFSGAQRRFINAAAASGLTLIAQDVGSYGFFRTKDRPSPHNLHGSVPEFRKQAKNSKPPTQPWAFAYPADQASAQLDGKQASNLKLYFSPYAQPQWKWDAKKGLWMRYEREAPHKVASGKQLSATNVVMLEVTVRYTSATSVGMSVPETLVSGKSGKGYVATGDRYIPITWSKKGQFDPFIFKTKDGSEVVLAPGQTWVEMVPVKGDEFKGTITIS